MASLLNIAWTAILAHSFLPNPSLASIISRATVSCGPSFTSELNSLFKRGGIKIESTTLNPPNATAGNTFEYCAVVGSIPYTRKGNDSLNFYVYLPDRAQYTGRFMAVGNGGFAGTIDTTTMLEESELGFAVAGGDAGHLASLNNGATGAPGLYLPFFHDVNQVEAWIHNAISIFTPTAKSIVQIYYGAPAKYNYYLGCSTGGAQGFALAQYHPTLFDGIYAGSPGNYYAHLMLSFLWNYVKTQGSGFIPQDTLSAITNTVIAECDTLDGVEDGMLENPLRCPFNIDKFACSAGSNNTCLTAAQLTAVKQIYQGPRSTINGKKLYAGFNFGTESSWLEQETELAPDYAIPLLQNLVYDNLDWNYTQFDFGSDVAAVDSNAGQYIDEITTNLSVYKKHGGKFLVTQGWADPYNAAAWPIEHLHDLESKMGGVQSVSDFFKIFMIPGGGHCTASTYYNNSPASYKVQNALIAWVEQGQAPTSVLTVGTANNATAERILCPWPETATYLGGDIETASSYVCGYENSGAKPN